MNLAHLHLLLDHSLVFRMKLAYKLLFVSFLSVIERLLGSLKT